MRLTPEIDVRPLRLLCRRLTRDFGLIGVLLTNPFRIFATVIYAADRAAIAVSAANSVTRHCGHIRE